MTPGTTSSSHGHDADQHLNEHDAQEISREDKPEDQKITAKNVPQMNDFTSLVTDDADEHRERSPEKQREDDPAHDTASQQGDSLHQQEPLNRNGESESHLRGGLKIEQAPEEGNVGQYKKPQIGKSEKAGSCKLEDAEEEKIENKA